MYGVGIAKRGLLTAAITLVSAVAVQAQTPPAPPKPGPETQKLGYFVGNWKSEGTLKANPMMPAGKYSSTDHCEWFPGNFAVICHSDGTGPAGPTKGIGVLGYSGEEKVYTYYGVDNSGMVPTTVAKGTVTGDTWTYMDEPRFGGKPMKMRYTMKILSPTSYTFRMEVQGEDGQWMTMMEGTATKA